MQRSTTASSALRVLLTFAAACAGDDSGVDTETGASTGAATGTSTGAATGTSGGMTETSTSTGATVGTSAATQTGTGTSTDTTTDTGDAGCVDDSDCVERGLICHPRAGVCVAASCDGAADFTPCETVTSPDRAFDICVGGSCVSPGCGDVSCNVPAPHFPLADTNQRQCYSATEASPCPSPGEPLYGQDAQLGWDATHPASERFTRELGVVGEPVVIDHVTALVWQGCNVGLSGDDCAVGFATKAAWADQLATCDALSWGGYDDWRLPDPYEMQSLVDQTPATEPTIDPTAFPATTGDWHWVSSSSSTQWAWTVLFAFGTVASDYKENTRSARCVRGGPLQPRHFEPSILAGDRVVTDTQSGMIWQGCPQGTSGADCEIGMINGSSWEGALAYCEELAWAGLTDWRLPNINELQSIVDYRYSSLSLDPDVFPGLSHTGWTSTTRGTYISSAMSVSFEFGTTFAPSKVDGGAAVRCVHDP